MSTTSKTNVSKGQTWAARILSLLIILAFVPSGIMKIMHHPMAVEGFKRMGIPEGAILPRGLSHPADHDSGDSSSHRYLGGAVLANIVNRSDFIHALVVGLFVWTGA